MEIGPAFNHISILVTRDKNKNKLINFIEDFEYKRSNSSWTLEESSLKLSSSIDAKIFLLDTLPQAKLEPISCYLSKVIILD